MFLKTAKYTTNQIHPVFIAKVSIKIPYENRKRRSCLPHADENVLNQLCYVFTIRRLLFFALNQFRKLNQTSRHTFEMGVFCFVFRYR